MEDARQLILQAFQQACASGKPDWHRMTTAVLKNRMLGLTRGEFSEASYNVRSFTEFLSQYGDMTTLDTGRVPAVVELAEQERSRIESLGSELGSPRSRIRGDLWKAALDYASGLKYVWDSTTNRARPEEHGDDYHVIPTIATEQLQRWRTEFLHAQTDSASLGAEDLARLSHWSEHQLPTSELPSRLIPKWNRNLKDRIHEHLRAWFTQEGLSPPVDLLISPPSTATRSPDTDELRRLVIRIVEQMTERELSDLVLPPGAILRAMGRRPNR